MQIKYRFSLNGQIVNPIYKDDIAKEYEMEPDQRFFRTKLSGKLRFIKNDFLWIMAQAFDTELVLVIDKSNDGGQSWSANYFTGSFFKTDCDFDLDSQKVEAKVNSKDQYTEILAGMEKEFDLLKLSPKREKLRIQKRPLIQVYFLGDPIVSCFLGGAYWEQAVDTVVNVHSEMAQYHFNRVTTIGGTTTRTVSGSGSFGSVPVTGEYSLQSNVWMSPGGDYRIDEYTYFLPDDPDNPFSQGVDVEDVSIVRRSDGRILFLSEAGLPGYSGALSAVPGSGASGYVSISSPGDNSRQIYMRYVTDSAQILNTNTYALTSNDMVGNNRNYRRTIGIGQSLGEQMVVTNSNHSTTPTEYGMAPNGTYYKPPYSFYGDKFYPIGRSSWNVASVWFRFAVFDWISEESGRVSYTMRDAIPISDVIRVLAQKTDPGITHQSTAVYSEFLYGLYNPISFNRFTILITQKTNILAGNYDSPAQRAPVTFSTILGMLRKTMQLYWFVDNQKRFRIEHISWFKNGGSYSGVPLINADLTKLVQKKNNKPWAFGTSKYSFDKPDMAERFEFSWMDEVTDAFVGYPIEIHSKYIQRGKIEEVSVSTFTSDIDYLLLNPNTASPEGFALFGAIWNSNEQQYELPYVQRNVDGADLRLQNGLMSFIYLQPNFWNYNLPSRNVSINNTTDHYIEGVERTLKQTISYPSLEDPDPLKLIKTTLGTGEIEKISVSLCSRMNKIELKYDSE